MGKIARARFAPHVPKWRRAVWRVAPRLVECGGGQGWLLVPLQCGDAQQVEDAIARRPRADFKPCRANQIVMETAVRRNALAAEPEELRVGLLISGRGSALTGI